MLFFAEKGNGLLYEEERLFCATHTKRKRWGEVKRQRIDKCPHCNSDCGVFIKMDLINVPKNLNFDGTDAYNGEMYDNAEKIIEKPTVYCQKCGKAICRWDKFCASNDIIPF